MSFPCGPCRLPPDGRYVFAFRLLEQGGGARRTALVRIDVDTGEQQEVCRGYGRMRVSPDTSQAACFDGDAIRLVTLPDGRVRDLAKTDHPPDAITWTPDGRFIVYRQTEAQSPASVPAHVTWIVPAAGGEPRRLDVPFGQQDLHFHPDGRHVATIDFEGSGELWVLENLKVD